MRILTNRAQQYVTTAEDRKSELAHVPSALRVNWALAPPSSNAKRPPSTENNPRRPMLVLPYMQEYQTSMARFISNTTYIYVPQADQNPSLDGSMYPKDKTPKEHQCGTVVYYNILNSVYNYKSFINI